MAIDLRAVQSAYRRGPPGPGFYGVPSREERIAESERVLVRLCEQSGNDPKNEGLGEHGALIGGRDKPTRVMLGNSRPFEHYCSPRLAPATWFQIARSAEPITPRDANLKRLDLAIKSYLAGTPRNSRPSPAELYAAFFTERPSDLERFWLHSILSCVTVSELRRIILLDGLPRHIVVSALHRAGVLRHDLSNWLNQFACQP